MLVDDTIAAGISGELSNRRGASIDGVAIRICVPVNGMISTVAWKGSHEKNKKFGPKRSISSHDQVGDGEGL